MDAFDSLRSEENLVDVTLSCEGYKIKAHKMLLSACSSYFKELFKDNPCQHPIVVFRNVRYYDLRALIDFIYQGEVNVMQDQLPSFLATAKLLEVKGLTDNSFGSEPPDGPNNNDSEAYEEENVSQNIEDEEIEEDETLSDVSQYAPQITTNESPSCPLSIIPITKTPGPPPPPTDHNPHKRKKRSEDEEIVPRQRLLPNLKPMPKLESQEMPPQLSFASKQSIEIFPITSIKTEKNHDDSYDTQSKDSRMDSKEYSSMNSPDHNLNEMEMYGTIEEPYQKPNMELNHLLTKSSRAGGSGGDMSQDSLQGHWLSSLNNAGDGTEAAITEANRKQTPSNADFSQQRHRYICSICGATYKHLRNLRAHCHLHYGKTRCNLCNKVLCNISYFKKHLQQQHGLLTTKKNDGKTVQSPSPSTTLNS